MVLKIDRLLSADFEASNPARETAHPVLASALAEACSQSCTKAEIFVVHMRTFNDNKTRISTFLFFIFWHPVAFVRHEGSL